MMDKKNITFILILFVMAMASCKSDKEKAEEFVNTLGKNSEVLLSLPASSPDCVFFTDGKIIKSHNVDNDSTKTIPYGDIDEDAVVEVLAGDSNITVITKEENVKHVYVYYVALQKFSEIKPFKANQSLVEMKLSKSNRSISFTYDESSSDATILDWHEYYAHEDDSKYLNKTAYDIVTKHYNFDGHLTKTEKKPVTIKEYVEKIEESEENAGDDNNYTENDDYDSSYRPVYLWKCRNCGQEAEGIEEPYPRGCPLYGGTVHAWYKVSQVR